MRRFITTLFGQTVSGVVIMALLVPFLTLSMISRASAQAFDGPTTSLPQWAVVEFSAAPSAAAGIGKTAAESFITQLQSQGKVDPFSLEFVDNKMKQMGLIGPLTKQAELMRLAQELRVSTVISGEIKNSRVVNVAGGKRADLIGRVIVWDVASGQSVNGAALAVSSGIRAGDVEDQTLLDEAATNFAFTALQSISANSLPTGTVLNTLDQRVLVNQGARTGFRQGQEVIVVRGREQVAAGVVSSVEPDKCFVDVKRVTKGVQPGDKIRAVFAVPDISPKFKADGSADVKGGGRRGNNSSIISLVLILAGLMLLTSSNGNGGAGSVVAEATTVPGSPEATPAVAVRWKVDGSLKGNQNRVQFQVWRDDVADAPILVVPGSVTSAVDRGLGNGTFNWTSNTTIPVAGGYDCVEDYNDQTATGVALNPGIAYTYSVELIYRVNSLDLPGSSSGSTSGSTGTTSGSTGVTTGRSASSFDSEYDRVFASRQVGTTTGTTSTGSTSGTTGTTGTSSGATYCYFRTDRVAAKGVATAFDPPAPRAPQNDSLVSVAPVFRFESVRGTNLSLTIEYALQFSTSPTFPANNSQTRVVYKFVDTVGTGILSTPKAVTEALTVFPSADTIYWRVGARNLQDSPGPVAQGGERYIFGNVWRFKRPVLPPNP